MSDWLRISDGEGSWKSPRKAMTGCDPIENMGVAEGHKSGQLASKMRAELRLKIELITESVRREHYDAST
jgi:hypothetical protein